MSRIRGKNTKPERIVRSMLHAMGYRFRVHKKDLPGKPDITLPKHKKSFSFTVVFGTDIRTAHGQKGQPATRNSGMPKSIKP